MATAKELRELTVQDLERRAVELREQLFRDRMKLKTGTLDSPTQRNERRRDLARVLTLITQKQRAAAVNVATGKEA
jgi:large subunit ribosomal protein L29